MTSSLTAKRGRKRSEQITVAILTAAYELTSEVGYHDLTIEGIAARAGCGKQTVYRWWSSKADVLMEALALKADLRVSLTDQGSFEADLGRFLHDSAVLLKHPGVAPVLRSLMSEAQQDPDFRRRFYESFLRKRREALGTLMTRASERGDMPEQLSAELCADLVFGLIWYRVLTTEPDLSDQDIAALQKLLSR